VYLDRTKAIAVKAMRTTLDADYSEPDFRNIPVEIEYPVKHAQIPSVWVNFDPIGPIRPVGIGHVEDIDAQGGMHRTTRWSFAGAISYTAITLSAFERDRLVDQMIQIIAFGRYDDQRAEFRNCFEHDPLVQINVNWDEIDQRGFDAAPGTPWGDDAMMYEGTIAINAIGEFVSTPSTELLLPITAWTLVTWVKDLENDPTSEDGWIQ
jgi:hypothetical protein